MPGTLAAASASARSFCEACSIPALSADEVINLQEREGRDAVVLVDVRTAPERRVAKLPGALSAAEFEALSDDSLRRRTVIVYCTVGKRSGDFATKLETRPVRPWGALFNSEGIVPYSHHPKARRPPYGLVDESDEPATRLHVFAFPWDLGSGEFEAVKFNFASAALAVFFPRLLS